MVRRYVRPTRSTEVVSHTWRCIPRFDDKVQKYHLTSVACESCDVRLGKYSCGVPGKYGPPHRQLLMDITQKHITGPQGVTLRVMGIELPMVLPMQQRVCWCPRHPRGTGGRGRSVRHVPRGQRASPRAASLPVDSNGAPIEALMLKNDLPDWDAGTWDYVLASGRLLRSNDASAVQGRTLAHSVSLQTA